MMTGLYADYTVRDFLKGAFWLLVLVAGVCAFNGVWWLFWYATLPITAPLFLIYMVFDSGALVITPMAIMIGLLVAILIQLEKK
jgi:hypothetical protein